MSADGWAVFEIREAMDSASIVLVHKGEFSTEGDARAWIYAQPSYKRFVIHPVYRGNR
jgi:hypothetical protein